MNQSLPYTKTIPFYAYLIRLNNIAVGSIQKITVNSDRQELQRIRELGNSRGPEIKEHAWGGVNTTIDIERIELYSSSLMQALGYPLFYSLEDFNFTFDIQELVYKPTSENVQQGSNTLLRNITYKDCIPIKWSKTIDRNTLHIIESMQVSCRKIKVLSYNETFRPEN